MEEKVGLKYKRPLLVMYLGGKNWDLFVHSKKSRVQNETLLYQIYEAIVWITPPKKKKVSLNLHKKIAIHTHTKRGG